MHATKITKHRKKQEYISITQGKISSQLEKEPKINLYWEENKKEWEGKDFKTTIEIRFKDLGEMW